MGIFRMGGQTPFSAVTVGGHAEVDASQGTRVLAMHFISGATGGFLTLYGQSRSEAEAGLAADARIVASVRSTNVVTVTTAAAHGFAANEYVVITGSEGGAVDGTFLIASVPDTTSFTFDQTGDDDASILGGICGNIQVVALPTSSYGDTANVKTVNTATSYTCVWDNVPSKCRMVLALGGGTHTVKTDVLAG